MSNSKSEVDLTQRMTNAERDQSFADTVPKDAATLILIDRSGSQPKVLLGKRHHAHKFMPGKFVFPGGRIEDGDAQMAALNELNSHATEKLKKRVAGTVREPRAFPLATIRELCEETGLMLGQKRDIAPAVPNADWQAFASAKVHPDLAQVHFVARAITPPKRPKRFDTRFFTADTQSVAHKIEGVVSPDSELVELVWIPIVEAKKLDMPTISGVVLDELAARVAAGMGHDLPVPFYYMENQEFQREVL
jgi:8-oxo-dGTP pyrophosphatase MutT (NUDIX family)